MSTAISNPASVLTPGSPPAPIPLLVLTVPGTQSGTSPDGNPVPISYPAATTTGGLAPIQINYSQLTGTAFPVGTTPVLVTANDASGQIVQRSFSVVVTFVPPPPPPPPPPPVPTLVSIAVTGPTSGTVGQTLGYTALGHYSDGSTKDVTALAAWQSSTPATAVPIASPNGSFTTVGAGTTTIKATYQSIASTGVLLTVNLNPPPPPLPLVLTCPTTQNVVAPTNVPQAVTYPAATNTGGSAPYTTTYGSVSGLNDLVSGSLFPVGTTTVFVKTTSADGQIATCSFSVIVVFNPPPSPLVITCPQSVTQQSPTGASIPINYPAATTTGGVAPVVFLYGSTDGLNDLISGSTFSPGVTTVHVRATSADAQVAKCSFTVTVLLPPPPPPPTTPSNFTPADQSVGVSLQPTLQWQAPGATSYLVAFGPSTPPPTVKTVFTPLYTPGTLLAGTTYYWKITAVNAGGSTAGPIVRFATIATLKLACPGNQSVQATSGNPSVVVNYPAAQPSGGIGPYTVTYSQNSGTLFPVGNTLVTATAQSTDGQKATCSFTVSVIPTTPPAGLYVDWNKGTDGTNVPGTFSQPWRTLNFAMGQLVQGQTLWVRGDPTGGTAWTYLESLTNPTLISGSAWTTAPTIASYPGENVWVKSNTNTQDVLHFSGNYRYIIFNAINLDGTGSFGDVVKIEDGFAGQGSSHHIRLQNLEIKNPGVGDINTSGVSVQTGATAPNGGGGNQFLSLTIHGVHGGTGGQGDGSHCFYISSLNTLIDSCNLYDYHGAGIQSQANFIPATGNIYRKNRIHDPYLPGDAFNRRWGIVISEDGSTTTGDFLADNLIWNIPDPGGAAPHWGYGIHIFSGTNTSILNNTVYAAATTGIFIDSTPGNSGTLVQNNLAFGNGTDYQDLSGGPTTRITNFFGTDPQWVAPTASPPDFHLKSTSAALGAGTSLSQVPDDLDGVLRGNPPACGCYET